MLTLPNPSTLYRLARPCALAWQSRQSSLRLSHASVTAGSLIFPGVSACLWWTISPALYSPFAKQSSHSPPTLAAYASRVRCHALDL